MADANFAGVDLSPFVPSDDEEREVNSRASKMIAALRNQQMQGSLLKMTGAPGLAGLGEDMIQTGEKGADAAMRYGPEQQLLKRTIAGYQLGGKLGSAAINGQTQRDVAGTRADAGIQIGAGHDAARIEAARAMAQNRGDLLGIKQAQQHVAFGKDFDPDMNPGMKIYRQKQFIADRASALAQGDDGAIKDLNSQQMEEFALGLHSMFINGVNGRPNNAQIQALVPSSAIGDANKFAQWWLNAPQGLAQKSFVKQMLGTFQRERKVSSDAIHSEQAKVAARWSPWIKQNWESASKIMSASGYDPDEVLKGFAPDPTLAPPGGQPPMPQPGQGPNVGVHPLPPPGNAPPGAPPNPAAGARIQEIEHMLTNGSISPETRAKLQQKLQALKGM